MSWLSDLPVPRKLGYAMLLTTAAALVPACGVFLGVEYFGYRRSTLHNVATLAEISAVNNSAAVAFHDGRGARQNLEALRALPQLIAATLYDGEGKIVARFSPRPEDMLPLDARAPDGVRVERGYVVAVQPILEGPRRLGTLHLQTSMEEIYARMRTYVLIVAGVLASATVLAGLIAAILRRTLAQPILELADTAVTVSEHQDYSQRARQYGRDELGQLTVAFNAMLDKTQASLEGLRASERTQRELLRSLPVPCYVVDATGRLTLFNDAAIRLWGHEPQLGETWIGELTPSARVAPGELPLERSLVALALHERRAVRGVEAWVVRRDGSRRWVMPHLDPIFDAQGRCTGVVNVIMDVTDERIAHEKVQKTAEHLSLAISASNLGDWNWEAATDLITLSPRTQEIFGIASTPGLTRSSMRDLLHPDDRERTRIALRHALETRADYDIEYRILRRDGTHRWIAAKGRSSYDRDGTPIGMVGVIQDITERKQQAEKLERLAREIENQARLFEATLSNLTDLAYAFDTEGRFIFANTPLLDLWAVRLDAVVGKRPRELGYPPAFAARLEREIAIAIAGKQAVRGEASLGGANGIVEEHEYILNPVVAPDGNVTAVVGSTRIITERKRAEATLRQSEAQLRLVTDNAPVLLVRTDRRHRYVFVNRAYAVRNGRTSQELVGQPIADIVGEAAFAAFRPRMDEALAGARVEFEMEVPYAALGRRWIHVIYVPEKDQQGNVTGLLGVISDIGERKHAELELKRARDEAVAASRAKDDFLAALSHELRTPLNPVLLLASDAANNTGLPTQVREDFEFIRKNVDLEARLIDDLLDLTRIVHGKLQIHARTCDLHDILNDAIANVRSDLAGKKLTLKTDFGAASSIVVGDSIRLQQVFWNILKNAVKFTPPDGRIRITTQQADPRHIRVEISDSGIGMTPEEKARAFQAFTQGEHAAQATSVHRFGGLGLGLAITKMLVDLHQGTIHATSEGRDRGAIFTVELPLAPVADAPVAASTAAPPAPPFEVPPANPPPEKMLPAPVVPVLRRVLLVEDHAATRTTLQLLLKKRGYEVLPAECAEKAEALAAANAFDIVISDVGLPDRNGYELMTALRLRNPQLLGIALSGYGMEEDLNQSRAAGFALHLVKPVTIRALEEAIASLTRSVA